MFLKIVYFQPLFLLFSDSFCSFLFPPSQNGGISDSGVFQQDQVRSGWTSVKVRVCGGIMEPFFSSVEAAVQWRVVDLPEALGSP